MDIKKVIRFDISVSERDLGIIIASLEQMRSAGSLVPDDRERAQAIANKMNSAEQ